MIEQETVGATDLQQPAPLDMALQVPASPVEDPPEETLVPVEGLHVTLVPDIAVLVVGGSVDLLEGRLDRPLAEIGESADGASRHRP